MRHLRLPLILLVFIVATWADEHSRGGILFSEWELRQVTKPFGATPAYRVASLGDGTELLSEEPRSDLSEQPASNLPEGWPELPGSAGEVATEPSQPAPRAPAPQVAMEDVCVAMASAAQIADLPVGFFARLIWQESKFNQWVVSHAGAQGVAQFMPKTAEWIGLPDPFDPISALPASARFLRMLRTQFGNWGLAAAAYNAGPGRVMNWLAGRSSLPDETRNYVRIITGHDVEKWSAPRDIDISFHLPARAPCEGLAGLSRNVNLEKMSVSLEPAVVKVIEVARAEAAARAARKAAKAAQAKKLASKKSSARVKLATQGAKKKVSEASPAAPGKPLKIANN